MGNNYTAISKKVVGKSACDNPEIKVLWVVFSFLFFKEIWKNGTRGHARMFASAKGTQQSRLDSYSVRNSVVSMCNATFRDCRVHSFFDNFSRNSYMFPKEAVNFFLNLFALSIEFERYSLCRYSTFISFVKHKRDTVFFSVCPTTLLDKAVIWNNLLKQFPAHYTSGLLQIWIIWFSIY